RGTSDKVVTIHEGTRVQIIDSVATPDDPVSPRWYNVKINNGTKAWLRASDVERI
ncbi:MAG: SH3 domain-containing protein, partial [Muribaculaceae bacterium]|nr:SH3 domain-containing protein [Muribaculaceae bacterium]